MSRPLIPADAAVGAALTVAACGSSHVKSAPSAGSPTSTTATAQTKPMSGHTTVAVRNFAYSPIHLTVTAGTAVSFHNDDGTAHTATAENNAFSTGTINPTPTIDRS